MPKVRNVIALDTGRDLSDLLNAAGERYGFDPVDLLAGAIAEGGLREHAIRERPWPDVSYGLFQPAVKWLGPEATGLARATDGTALDTPENRARARDLCWDAAWLVVYVAPRYAALLKRWGDATAAWCRWNKPNVEPEQNPNMPNYVTAFLRAYPYITQEEPAMPADTEQPSVEEQIKQLSAQQALQTAALRRILEGKLEGADGAAGAVVALEGGQTSIEVALLKDGA